MDRSEVLFDSGWLPSHERAPFMREGLAATIGSYDMTVLGDGPTRQVIARTLPALPGHVTLTTSSVDVVRRPDRGGESAVMLEILRAGANRISQRGREDVYRAGDATVLTTAEPFRARNEELCAFDLIVFSPQQLASRVADPAAAMGIRIPAESPALTLMRHYLAAVERSPQILATGAAVVQDHLLDLLALAIGETPEVRERARVAGVPAARLAAMKTFLRERWWDPQLDIGVLSARFRVSERYIRRLFEPEGGFHSCLTAARVGHAARMLADPAFDRLKVIDIAFRCGFASLSTFNRAFARHCGHSPSAHRELARRQGPGPLAVPAA